MRRLSVEMFQNFWSKVERNDQLMDGGPNIVYTEWQEEKQDRYGMRHQHSGKRHGIVRHVRPGGEIIEASFKGGRFHGLQRYVSAKEVIISLWKDDEELAYVGLDKNFKKSSAHEAHHLDELFNENLEIDPSVNQFGKYGKSNNIFS